MNRFFHYPLFSGNIKCALYACLLTTAFNSFSLFVFAQGAAVNDSGAVPHASAMLDVSSSDSGVLIPRMTESQKNAISGPAEGLMIYQTDGTSGFWYFDGSVWSQIGGGGGGSLDPGTAAGNTPYWNGSAWVVNSANIYNNGGSIGIGTTSPDASALLDLQSTTKGFALPRMTTAERDAITNPAVGLQIVNTTTKCVQVYLDPMWQNLFCGCNRPATPAVSSSGNVRTTNRIVWNWNNVSGVSGYKYNTANDYATAVDNGTNLQFNQTGLSCGTTYTLYVWSYSACQNSATPLTLTETTASCYSCGSSVAFTYKGGSVNYGSVMSPTGNCWLDRNLGASQVATSSTDASSYGDLFQWGRLDDGHQTRTSGTTTTLSTGNVPGNALFITNTGTSPFDWRNPQNNNLWQGVSGINNPCPSGWRLPSLGEWTIESASWASQNSAGAFGSPLKLPMGGQRNSSGTLSFVGTQGRYHANTIQGTNSQAWLFSSGSNSLTPVRAEGLSVRCVKD